MAKKISQLTQATEVKSDDVTVIVQDGETKKLPLNMMVTKQDIENKKVAGLAKLDEIEATYENDTYTPTITVKNKSSVKTGEGDEVDYSANVMDGHVKSAILKGKTINNLWTNSSEAVFVQAKTDDTTIEFYSEQYDRVTFGETQVNAATTMGIKTSQRLQANKTYYINTFVFDALDVTDSFLIRDNSNSINLNTLKIEGYPPGQILSFTTQAETNNIIFYYFAHTRKYGAVNYGKPFYMPKRFIISDKLEDVVNQEFFEGMQSVKMPVLTSVSSTNLYVMDELLDEKVIISNFENSSTDFIKVYPNEKIFFSTQKDYNYARFYDENKQPIGDYIMIAGWNPTDGYFGKSMSIVPENGRYLKVFIRTNHNWEKLTMVNRGEDYLPYEKGKPYKSNILTVNEEVELRGIGDVRDELDCLMGEITERIGEVVLNGSEDEGWSVWRENDNSYGFALMNYNIDFKQATIPLCNRLASAKYIDLYNGTINSGIALLNGNAPGYSIFIRLSKTECFGLEDFKTKLQANPITVQYELATPVVKTVDLMPSGTHPSTTPYCWKNGHIQLSSSGLLPNLEYSVVTSRAGQINQNATMIVKNDKRIFDLEILLAGGLVNTTYQALTLQNQVETGLSKVSLSSETEPDYLLYHMIMKLIEEKAYKLDDLTEKVSVFYLYEKLSDEQFETIYSALYPFVEDEIVEEPVVEELPEVVEDEVIM